MFKDIADKITDFDDNVFQNIPTIIVSEDLMDDLSENQDEYKYGEALVAAKIAVHESPIITRTFKQASGSPRRCRSPSG